MYIYRCSSMNPSRMVTRKRTSGIRYLNDQKPMSGKTLTEDTMPRETSQSQKDRHTHTRSLEQSDSWRPSRTVVARGWEEEKTELLNGYRIPVFKMKKVLELDTSPTV